MRAVSAVSLPAHVRMDVDRRPRQAKRLGLLDAAPPVARQADAFQGTSDAKHARFRARAAARLLRGRVTRESSLNACYAAPGSRARAPRLAPPLPRDRY